MDVCWGNGKTNSKFSSRLVHFVGKNLSLPILYALSVFKLNSVVEDLFIGIYYFMNQGFCPLQPRECQVG